MDIRKKTGIIIGLTLVGLILVLLLLSEVIVVGEFNSIETKSVENDMYRVMTAISYDLLQMDTMAHEWANRPSVLTYFSNPSRPAAESLLEDKTFERLQYNVIIFFDSNGKMMGGKMYDLNTHKEIPLPESLVAYISPKNRFFEQSNGLRLSGIIKLADGPMFISMRKVQQNGDSGPVVGSILAGRYFDEQVLYQISMLTNTSLGKFEYTDRYMPQDVVDSIPKIPFGQPFFIRVAGEDAFEFNAPMYTRPANETYVATYARLNDIFESPTVIVRMTVPRDIYIEGRHTTTVFLILLFIACLLFGIAILLLLETTVLSRISRMSKEVGRIGSEEGVFTQVSGGGSDEIGRLATSVNWMLKELEAAHDNLKSCLIQTEDRYRVIFNSNNDIVFVFSIPDPGAPASMVEVNDAGCTRLGYTREEFLLLRPEQIVAQDPYAIVSRLTTECTRVDHVNLETKFVTKTGDIIPIEVYAHIILQLGRPAILAICHDITERLRNEQLRNEAFQQAEIKKSLAEKEMLLKEIHHRVKNNMQVISSLLQLQAQSVKDEATKTLFKESQTRIKSIALVHEQLYRSDSLSQIEYGGYLRKMFGPLFESYKADAKRIGMVIEAENVLVTIEKAVPCSLIVNELMSNSLKYAFPGDRKGEIRIRFSLDEANGNYILDYSDNGIGLPEGFVPGKTGSLGTSLINGLTKQLKGTLTMVPGPGVHYVITFPAKDLRGK